MTSTPFLPLTSTRCRLRNLMRCVPRCLEYSSTCRHRAPCASEPALWRVAEPRPLRCAGAHVLQYTSHLCALRTRTRALEGCGTSSAALRRRSCTPVHIAPVRLADENPRFRGLRNLMRCVLHGTRREGRSVPGGSRAVRTFGVHLVRIASRRLAHQNLRFKGRNLMRRVPRGPMYSSTHRLRAPCA